MDSRLPARAALGATAPPIRVAAARGRAETRGVDGIAQRRRVRTATPPHSASASTPGDAPPAPAFRSPPAAWRARSGAHATDMPHAAAAAAAAGGGGVGSTMTWRGCALRMIAHRQDACVLVRVRVQRHGSDGAAQSSTAPAQRATTPKKHAHDAVPTSTGSNTGASACACVRARERATMHLAWSSRARACARVHTGSSSCELSTYRRIAQ